MIKINVFVFFSAEFSIWTREAGAGGLSIAVEGPSKAEITFEDRKDGSCGVTYVVQEPGEVTTDSRSDFWPRQTVFSQQQLVFLYRFYVTVKEKSVSSTERLYVGPLFFIFML